MEFPRHVHRPVDRAAWDAGIRVSRLVTTPEAYAAALADGETAAPVILEPEDQPAVVVDDRTMAEAETPAADTGTAAADAPIRRRPGRPRKADI